MRIINLPLLCDFCDFVYYCRHRKFLRIKKIFTLCDGSLLWKLWIVPNRVNIKTYSMFFFVTSSSIPKHSWCCLFFSVSLYILYYYYYYIFFSPSFILYIFFIQLDERYIFKHLSATLKLKAFLLCRARWVVNVS